jgi:hypothetical protein
MPPKTRYRPAGWALTGQDFHLLGPFLEFQEVFSPPLPSSQAYLAHHDIITFHCHSFLMIMESNLFSLLNCCRTLTTRFLSFMPLLSSGNKV